MASSMKSFARHLIASATWEGEFAVILILELQVSYQSLAQMGG